MTDNRIRVVDNDKDEVSIQKNGTTLMSWNYESESERRNCIMLARVWQDGYLAGVGL